MDAKTKFERILAIGSIILPLIGFILALYLGYLDQGVNFQIILLFLIFSFFTQLSIEMGYHRLFSHRSFQAHPVLKYLLIIIGSMAFQGPVAFYAGIHRIHHRYSDQARDPHSPHFPKNRKLLALFHAYYGWLFAYERKDWIKNSRDLIEDPLVKKLSRLYFIWLALGLMIPALLGGILLKSSYGALLGFLWGGLSRVFIVQQISYWINVLGHTIGSQPHQTNDHSRNLGYLSLFSLGSSWHNNHHAYPGSAFVNFSWWQIDITGLIIRICKKLGLVWDISQAPQTVRK